VECISNDGVIANETLKPIILETPSVVRSGKRRARDAKIKGFASPGK
jgi:hypothetical protein